MRWQIEDKILVDIFFLCGFVRIWRSELHYWLLPNCEFIIKKLKERKNLQRKWKTQTKLQLPEIIELATGVTLFSPPTMSQVFADSTTQGTEERTLADRTSQVKLTSNLRTWALSECSDELAANGQLFDFFIHFSSPTLIRTWRKYRQNLRSSFHTFTLFNWQNFRVLKTHHTFTQVAAHLYMPPKPIENPTCIYLYHLIKSKPLHGKKVSVFSSTLYSLWAF